MLADGVRKSSYTRCDGATALRRHGSATRVRPIRWASRDAGARCLSVLANRVRRTRRLGARATRDRVPCAGLLAWLATAGSEVRRVARTHRIATSAAEGDARYDGVRWALCCADREEEGSVGGRHDRQRWWRASVGLSDARDADTPLGDCRLMFVDALNRGIAVRAQVDGTLPQSTEQHDQHQRQDSHSPTIADEFIGRLQEASCAAFRCIRTGEPGDAAAVATAHSRCGRTTPRLEPLLNAGARSFASRRPARTGEAMAHAQLALISYRRGFWFCQWSVRRCMKATRSTKGGAVRGDHIGKGATANMNAQLEPGTLLGRREILIGAGAALLGLGAGGGFPSTYFNRRIPDEAHQKMGELAKYGITTFSFTPTGGWVMVTRDGRYFARGIPDECYQKLGEFVKKRAQVHCIAFPAEGGNRWVIATNKGIFARGVPDECYQTILDLKSKGREITHVAFAPAGGNRWVVIADGKFMARNIDDECYQMMRNLSQARKVTRVEFRKKNNGWLVVAENEMHARRIDDECYEKLGKIRSAGWLLQNVAFCPVNDCWSIYSHIKAGSYPEDRARVVESSIPKGRGTTNIWARMNDYQVPGCAIAVVDGNKRAWSCGYGFLERGVSSGATHPESRFQAASLSKPVAALGVMKLTEDTDIEVTDDIRGLLNWTLPTRSCLTPTNSPTIDRILRHRGGIIGRNTTNPTAACSGFDEGGGGFAGYAEGKALPSLLDILKGKGTNSPPVELTTDPGSKYSYSGAGFVLLQRMIEEQASGSFAQYMQQRILGPLGMKHSAYTVSVPNSWITDKQVAAGHKSNGTVIAGKRNRYPEFAAAGLYTSVDDLSKVLVFLNRAWVSNSVPGPLKQPSVKTLLSGRGFAVSGSSTSKDFAYSHNGSNYGFRCTMAGFPNRAAGYVIMTNGESGDFVADVKSAITKAYGW